MTDETDFMDELEAATRLKPSDSSHFMLLAVASLVGAFIVWAGFSEIEERIRGGGQVVPTSEIQVVQSLEGGILSELLVSEGAVVEKDQVLLRISDVASASEERGVEARSVALKAKRARLKAEADGSEFSLSEDIRKKAPKIAENEEALYHSRQQELDNAQSILEDKISRASAGLAEVRAKIARLADSRTLLQKELTITREMVKKRAVPQLEEIRLTRELNDISGQIREASQKRSGLEAELRAARKEREDQRAKFHTQALGELNEVETSIKQLDENLTTIGDRVFDPKFVLR